MNTKIKKSVTLTLTIACITLSHWGCKKQETLKHSSYDFRNEVNTTSSYSKIGVFCIGVKNGKVVLYKNRTYSSPNDKYIIRDNDNNEYSFSTNSDITKNTPLGYEVGEPVTNEDGIYDCLITPLNDQITVFENGLSTQTIYEIEGGNKSSAHLHIKMDTQGRMVIVNTNPGKSLNNAWYGTHAYILMDEYRNLYTFNSATVFSAITETSLRGSKIRVYKNNRKPEFDGLPKIDPIHTITERGFVPGFEKQDPIVTEFHIKLTPLNEVFIEDASPDFGKHIKPKNTYLIKDESGAEYSPNNIDKNSFLRLTKTPLKGRIQVFKNGQLVFSQLN